MAKGAGELCFAPRNVAHAHHSDVPARYVLVCTPAGFERHSARIAARAAGVEPPRWVLQPIPAVTVVGPQIAVQLDLSGRGELHAALTAAPVAG